jgi:hypothetical protein
MIGDVVPVFDAPLEEVTVYPVIVEPPVALAVNATLACGALSGCPPTFVTEVMVGACGTEEGVIDELVEEARLVPLALEAVTV